MIDIEELVAQKKLGWERRRLEWAAKMEVLRQKMERSDELRVQFFRKRADKIVKKHNEYVPWSMEHWFAKEKWSVHEAMILLCEFRPEQTDLSKLNNIWRDKRSQASTRRLAVRLDGLDFGNQFVQEVIGKMAIEKILTDLQENYKKLISLWNGGWHTQEHYTPQYFILWALSKRYTMSWLPLAIKYGYFAEQGGVFPSHSTLVILVARMRDAEQAVADFSDSPPQEVLGITNRAVDPRVAWRHVLASNIAVIDKEHNGKAGVMQVIRWLKNSGGRITSDGAADEIVWLDDNHTRQTVKKKTISNAITSLRNPG